MKKLYFAFLLVVFAVVTANATVTVRKFPTDTPTSVLTNNETNPTFNGLTISAGSTLFMAEGSTLRVDSIFPNAEESISVGSSASFLGDGNPSQFTTGIVNYAHETIAGSLYIAPGSSAQMDKINMIATSPITTKGMIWYDGTHFFGVLANGSSKQLDN
jgi:hypothetical protein